MSRNNVEQLISKLQIANKEHPLSEFDLGCMLNVDKRVVRDWIRDARREGFAIVASKQRNNKGYYIASNDKELGDLIEDYKGRALDMLVTAQALKKIPLKDQLSITDIDRIVEGGNA